MKNWKRNRHHKSRQLRLGDITTPQFYFIFFLFRRIRILDDMVVKRENIHRPPVFYIIFKNTQFLHFLAGIHLKLHFFSLFHFCLESVKKTNGNLKKWPFYPQNKNYNFTLKIIKNNQIKSNNFSHRSIKTLIPQPSNASFLFKICR